MSSTASKSVLLTYPKPVTLTIVQFLLVSGWCIFLNRLASSFPVLRRLLPVLKHGLVKPSWEVVRTTLPLTFFMIFGHITSSDAISRIDVSLVHTIKGLSPLITVAAYHFIFRVNYDTSTYLSLMPLTIGVFLACSTNFRANFIGIFMAFLSAVIFVTQNIVSKSIFNEAAVAEADPTLKKKPDKLSLLCYSSLIAVVFTAPIWFWSEGWHMLVELLSQGTITLSSKQGSLDHRGLLYQYLLNGSFHFLQSLAAFILLSVVTPVTYSVASLIKRVFVIVFSILWWRSPMTPVQGFGIALTFLGLYLYDRSGDTAKLADRRGLARVPQGLAILGSSAVASSNSSVPLLPVVERGSPLPPHVAAFPRRTSRPPLFGGGPPRSEPLPHGPLVENGEGRPNGWLPAGTKAEETWSARDVGVKVS
jgi:solute carrier family 35 protein E1